MENMEKQTNNNQTNSQVLTTQNLAKNEVKTTGKSVKTLSDPNLTKNERYQLLNEKHFHKLDTVQEKKILGICFIITLVFSLIGTIFIFSIQSSASDSSISEAGISIDLIGFWKFDVNNRPSIFWAYWLVFPILFIAISSFVISFILEVHWKFKIRKYRWSYYLDIPILILFIILTIITVFNKPIQPSTDDNSILWQNNFIRYIGKGYDFPHEYTMFYFITLVVVVLVCIYTAFGSLILIYTSHVDKKMLYDELVVTEEPVVTA